MGVTRAGSRAKPLPLDPAQSRMVALMRCVLSFSALAIIYVDPSEPARLVPLTYGSLSAYGAYSAYVALKSQAGGWPSPTRASHWGDVLFYVWLIALTEGTASIFFYFFFFAILVAAFSFGHREGVRVSAFSALCFAASALFYPDSGPDYELNRALIRPVYLMALGYMITYWGGHEVLLKHRLRLLHDINTVSSPRFGLEHTLARSLRLLLDFYGATSAVLVLERTQGGSAQMLMALAGKADNCESSALGQDVASTLLALSPSQAVLYAARGYARPAPACEVAWSAGDTAACDVGACERAAAILDTDFFASVPYAERDGVQGRLYLNAPARLFTRADGEFLVQAAAAVAVVAESLRLMEQLISNAAEHERYRVSRDLHDSTIQPYIGLKLGLEGLYRELPEGDAADRVRGLIEMTDRTIDELRDCADRLRQEKTLPGELLAAAVAEQAQRYRTHYGLDFSVESHFTGRLSGRLAAEVFQLVVEGMSNALRHAASKTGFIWLSCDGRELALRLGNRVGDGAAPAAFRPRSMSERVAELGGTLAVRPLQAGHTVIEVVIPV